MRVKSGKFHGMSMSILTRCIAAFAMLLLKRGLLLLLIQKVISAMMYSNGYCNLPRGISRSIRVNCAFYLRNYDHLTKETSSHSIRNNELKYGLLCQK